MSIQEDINKYFELQKNIYNAFGYIENWKVIPMMDYSDDYWMIIDTENKGEVVWSPNSFDEKMIKEGETIYSGQIYTQRFLNKFVYRTETHVMIVVDTQTDGNKFLMIFDASKECTDSKMKEAYKNSW